VNANSKIVEEFHKIAKDEGILWFWVGLLVKKNVGEDKFGAITNDKKIEQKIFEALSQLSKSERLSFLSLLDHEKYINSFKKVLKIFKYLIEFTIPKSTSDLINLYEKVSSFQYKNISNIYFAEHEMYQFMIRLLEIRDNITIYNPAFGPGRFFFEVLKENDTVKISGSEINETHFLIANTVLSLMGYDNSGLNCKNAILAKNFPSEKFDRIFIEPPLGVNLEKEKIHEYSVATYKLGWPEKLEIALLEAGIELLKDDGLLAAVLSEHFFCRNELTKEIRKALINENLLDGIIKLPTVNKNIDKVILVVLKKNRKTNQVTFMDLSESYEALRSKESEQLIKNYLSKKTIQGIMKIVNPEEIKQKSHNLLPTLYIHENESLDFLIEESISNKSVRLGEIAKLFSGININSEKLSNDSELRTFVDSFMLKPSSIDVRGWIELYIDEKSMKLLSKNEQLLEKLKISKNRLLKNGDIIIVSRGGIGKVGYTDAFIAKFKPFPGNNLIVIRLKNKKKYPPRILFEYLRSDSIKKWIESEVGSRKTLNIKELNNLPVPRFSEDFSIESELSSIEKTAFEIRSKLSELDKNSKKLLVDLLRKK